MAICQKCGQEYEGKTCLNCKLEYYDNDAYRRFTTPQVLEKELHTLEGILKGIVIDHVMNSKETEAIKNWLNKHKDILNVPPYDDLIYVLESALADNILTTEERDDLIWLCENLETSSVYYDVITTDLQKLHGILYGILADGKIKKEEAHGLKLWLEDNEHLASYYPYDELYSLLVEILKDGVISPAEEAYLKEFCLQFTDIKPNKILSEAEHSELKNSISKRGICTLGPNIEFEGKTFCFTGKSSKASRAEIACAISKAKGIYHDNVIAATDYLIVGDEGSPCWAFSCYGRKVEKAINMRKKGSNIILVHEVDFWDCL